MTKESAGIGRGKAAILSWMSPDILAGAAASVVLFSIIYFRKGRIEIFTSSIVLPLCCVAAAVIVELIKHWRTKAGSGPWTDTAGALRAWGGLVLMVFVYENLRSGIDQSGSRLIDAWLLKADVALFGVEPTVWLQRWYHPLVVDMMAMFYATYFAIPVSVLFILYMKNRTTEFRVLATAVVLTLALGYAGYLVFPASPPRFSIADRFTDPAVLSGVFFHNRVQQIWDSASTSAHFCAFPSLHVGLSSTGVLWAFVYRRHLPGRTCTASILGFVSLMLWFSTLYLRHHWFADIAAGWLVAAAASAAGYGSVMLLKRHVR
jgi:membrane-associated phospholipid phosphatase